MSRCVMRCGSLIPKMNTLLNTEVLSDIITYYVKYVGSIEIFTSLQNIDQQTKGWFIKECIQRVCESAGIEPCDQTTIFDKEIIENISEKPDVTHSGVIVMMSISSCNITLVKADTGDVIIAYDMPRIVFITHSDLETSNYFALVIKEDKTRICYILEGIHDCVKDIIGTIRYAFDYSETCESIYEKIDEQKSIYAPQCISKMERLRPGLLNVGENEESSEKMDKIDDQCIKNEVWYHCMLSRRRAEKLLKRNGDFLVRISKEQNEHVLSTMTDGIKVHFLLTNCNGVIRTNKYVYDSITHLIRYHHINLIPIYYYRYVLYLKKPL